MWRDSHDAAGRPVPGFSPPRLRVHYYHHHHYIITRSMPEVVGRIAAASIERHYKSVNYINVSFQSIHDARFACSYDVSAGSNQAECTKRIGNMCTLVHWILFRVIISISNSLLPEIRKSSTCNYLRIMRFLSVGKKFYKIRMTVSSFILADQY